MERLITFGKNSIGKMVIKTFVFWLLLTNRENIFKILALAGRAIRLKNNKKEVRICKNGCVQWA